MVEGAGQRTLADEDRLCADNAYVEGATRTEIFDGGRLAGTSSGVGSFDACPQTDRLIIRVLIRMGWQPIDLHGAIHRSRRDSVSLENAVLATPGLERREWTSALSEESGLPVLEELDPTLLVLPSDDPAALLCQPWQDVAIGYQLPDGRYRRLVPDSVGRARILPHERSEEARLVAGPVLRQALLKRLSTHIESEARTWLFVSAPQLSARNLTNAWQAFALGVIGMLFAVAFVFSPSSAFVTIHLCSSVFFLGCMLLRLSAVRHAGTKRPAVEALENDEDLPVYTVLVALYHEAEMVGQLLTALGRLRWPRGKLEIRLICEADDRETINAIHALRPPANVEVLEVPPGKPRTKPRALNFALQTCRGKYVCLYDAEDRPHPDQLIEAYQTFRRSPAELACLQAPLIVTNGDEHWLARQFAFEYAALFRGLLRYLSVHRAILPLGGTSNHFRRDALDEVCGWDPYNVTEDADLGVRMARAGYRSATIESPTLEDGPASFRDWLPQRTRWLKGWMVCWLVHNRHPFRLWRELGTRSFLIAQILLCGIAGSALLLPIMLLNLGWLVGQWLLQPSSGAPFLLALHFLDIASISLCLAAHLRLGSAAAAPLERRAFGGIWTAVPAYWLLQSLAAWRAVFHLVLQKPHEWEKTNHRPTLARLSPDYALRLESRKSSPSIAMRGSASPIASSSLPA